MALTRSDFPPAPVGVNRNNAAARGWGTGWPHCQTEKFAKVTKAGVVIYVRREVAEMVSMLLAVTEKLGYDVLDGQTWGAACRPIRGTRSASNHSWGLAVDLNSETNPMGSRFITDMPPVVVSAWWHSGWFWGGWYQNRPDAMHMEYVHTPAHVATDTLRARDLLLELNAPVIKWLPRSDAKAGTRLLLLGMVGDDVALVQRFLGITPANGQYGAATVAKVREYQKMRGIRVDGVVGPSTWRPMLDATNL